MEAFNRIAVAETFHIGAKFETVDRAFKARFGFSLWSEVPLTEFSEIARPVKSEDDLKLRITSLSAIFEVLNKVEFNRQSGVREKYSRDSFVSWLKQQFPNDQQLIQDHIQIGLAAIAHLRNHFSHRNRPMSVRDLNHLGVRDICRDPSETWIRVQQRLTQLLDKTLELIEKNSAANLSCPELLDKPLRVLVQETYERYKEMLEDPVISAMLREIMHENELLDTDLALRFNRPVKEVHALLFDLLDKVVKVRAHSSSSTKLRLFGPMAAALENPDEWLKDEVT